jgi:hypothetical protein
MFRYQGAYIVNEKGKVVEVSGAKDYENQNIQVATKGSGIHQQWDIVYADEYPDEPKKGEINNMFGLYVDRSFYIISELPQHRYLENITGNNLGIKTKNGRTQQVWWFDQKTLTIKSRKNNYSFDIQSSGNSSNMQIYSTNQKWW